MRCRWGLASFLSVLSVSATASAQEVGISATADTAEQDVAPPQAIVYGAMPGGIHAPTAETLPKGAVQVSTLAGLGRRTGLLGPDHKFNRAIGDFAIGFGATENISVGLSLDGRYDRHWGLDPSGDDGYVGDPKLIVRAAKNTGTVAFGGQLGIWVPGKDAPSVAASAISIDARALVSLPAGPGLLSFSGGFRLDNSAKSVDEPMRLSLQDRVSLGVSDYHALFGAAQLRIPVGPAWVGVEGSLDAFVGGPPTPDAGEVARDELARSNLLFRGGVTAGYHINEMLSAIVFVEAAKVPGINLAQVMAANIPLIPYEPIFTGGIGLQARFGGPKASKSFVELDCAKRNPPDCPPVEAPLFAEVTGTVVDTAGKPVVGALVTLTLKNAQVEPVVTDQTGTYVFKNVPIGKTIEGQSTVTESAIEVSASVDGMKPGTASIAQVQEPSNSVQPIVLEPVLPPGQLRGLVRSLASGGRPIDKAVVTVEPGGQKVETAADGTFTIDLAPGQYKMTVTAPGLKPQELDVTIDPNGVAIKNIDLQK